jgi:hypothetical protein
MSERVCRRSRGQAFGGREIGVEELGQLLCEPKVAKRKEICKRLRSARSRKIISYLQ